MQIQTCVQRSWRAGLAIILGAGWFALITATLSIAHAAAPWPAPGAPSVVTISGTRLIVQQRRPDGALAAPAPYVIKGVNWSPASACADQPQLLGEFTTWYTRDATLMIDVGVNTVRLFRSLAGAPNATAILDALYAHSIMVIMPVDGNVADSASITPTVAAFKDHPAILMWSVGNEWDLNRFYGTFTDTAQAAAFTEWAAQIVHGLDPNHPVASILGDIDRGAAQPLLPLPWSPGVISTRQIVSDLAPSVDVWGVNTYRGATLGGLFGQWQQISAEPMFVAEYGADAYDHRVSAENQTMQSEFDTGLWREIASHLSAQSASQPGLGGLVFEWNDEWWKNGTPCTHTISTETNPGQPDGVNDEEWFGLVTIDRQPRAAYDALKVEFRHFAHVTRTQTVSWSASSEYASQFFKDGAGFCYKQGGGDGGRGVNVAVIDRNSGAIQDCRNFDTHFDKQAFVTMTNYLSNSVPVGSIVLVAIADEGGFIRYTPPESDCHQPWDDPRVEQGYLALEALGSTQIRSAGYWGSWAMIAIKGQGALAEAYHDPIYKPSLGGFCQRERLVSSQVTARLTFQIVTPLPARVYLPIVFNPKLPCLDPLRCPICWIPESCLEGSAHRSITVGALSVKPHFVL